MALAACFTINLASILEQAFCNVSAKKGPHFLFLRCIMANQNHQFQDFVDAINQICLSVRSHARGGLIDHDEANKFRVLFTQNFPVLSAEFANLPGFVYARAVINFAVEILDDENVYTVWSLYFEKGKRLSDLAEAMHYSTRTVRRFVKSFPERIAVQIWESALVPPSPVPETTPRTLLTKAKRILENDYTLSLRASEALLVFCLTFRMGMSRKDIAEKLLIISPNTLKTHVRRIIRQMDKKQLNPAVGEAVANLSVKMGHDWVELRDMWETLDTKQMRELLANAPR